MTAPKADPHQILDTLRSTAPSFEKVTKAQQRFVWDISGALVSLLNALAETSEDISAAIAKSQAVTRFLVFLTTSGLTPGWILEDVLSCLVTISEDNRDLCQSIVDNDGGRYYAALRKLRDDGGANTALTSGLLHNIFAALEWHDYSRGKDGDCDAVLIPSLARVLARTRLETSLNDNAQGLAAPEILHVALNVVASIGTELQLSLARNKPRKQRSGLGDDIEPMNRDDEDDEVVVSNEADVENGDLDMEDGGESGDEGDADSMTDDLLADMDMVTGIDENGLDVSGLDDVPTLRALIQEAIPQLIRLACTPLTSEEELAVQSDALSALNNIAWTVSCIEFANGENPEIFQAWLPTAQRIWSKVITPLLATDTADANLAAGVASLGWALSRGIGGQIPQQGGEHRRFISLYQASETIPAEEEDPFQSLGVKCIGVLGQLARDPATIAINREVGVFLISILEALPKTAPAHAVEALNQVFDIYGDEALACDKEVFWKDGFLTHLESILTKAKAMVKTVDKRTSGELRMRADEAVLNLARFLSYKRKHRP